MSTSFETFTLFFEPLDLLLFRDHRPFDMGLHVLANSRFPLPSVFHGAVRTALVRHQEPGFFAKRRSGAEVVEQVGRMMTEWGLSLQGPLLAKKTEDGLVAFYPWPLDLVPGDPPKWKRRLDRPSELGVHHVSPLDGFGDAQPDADRQDGEEQRAPIFFLDGKEPKGGERRVLTKAGIEWWMRGKDAEVEEDLSVRRSKIYRSETRIGIARDPRTRHVQEGMFYVAVKMRFQCDHGLAVLVRVAQGKGAELKKALDGATVPLGGDGHRADVTVFDGDLLTPTLPENPGQPSRFLLLTPAPVTCRPRGMQSVLTSRKELPAGGFDFARKAPKPLTALWPAGTVFVGSRMAWNDDEENLKEWRTAGFCMHVLGE